MFLIAVAFPSSVGLVATAFALETTVLFNFGMLDFSEILRLLASCPARSATSSLEGFVFLAVALVATVLFTLAEDISGGRGVKRIFSNFSETRSRRRRKSHDIGT